MEVATTIEQLMTLVSADPISGRGLLGIDGFHGAGKTTLAVTLAEKMGGIRVGLDSYVERSREADRYVGLLRLEDLARDLNGLSQRFQCVVIEGVCLLEALAAVGVEPDRLLYVRKISAQGLWHDGFHLEDYSAGVPAGGWLAESVYSYHQQYQPHVRASLCYSWAGA